MLVSTRPRRFALVVWTVLAVAACSGPDLGKQNFPRTTVTASAPAQVTDGSLSLSALRTVDPCALIDNATLADLGTADGTNSDSFERCTNVVHDAGGKRLQVNLSLADLVTNTAQASGSVQGLPLTTGKLGASDCNATAVTSRTPDFGITVGINYDGGDACGTGQTVLDKVVRKLHANPPKLPQPAGSGVTVDLCTLPDDALMTEVLGRGTVKSPGGLHSCDWTGGVARGNLTLEETSDPAADGGTPVDLGGVTGHQKLDTSVGRVCRIFWTQLPVRDGRGEVMSVEYQNDHDDAGNDDACGKALRIARAVLPKLPRA